MESFGVGVSFDPAASLRTHAGGWFPVAAQFDERSAGIVGAPANWRVPRWSGFELYIDPRRALFVAKSSVGTGVAYLVALALAQLSKGLVGDPQLPLKQPVDDLEVALDRVRAALPTGWTFADVCSFPDDAAPVEDDA